MSADERMARERVQREVNQALRALTGNLIRIVRGGGVPKDLAPQVLATASAIVQFTQDYGEPPDPNSFGQDLLVELHDEQSLARMSNDQLVRADAEQDVMDGALAMVAARLMGDLARETKGRAQMRKGARALG